MPLVQLILPGEAKEADPIADVYRITVERGDGVACSDLEARTTMSMFCMQKALDACKKPKGRGRKTTRS